MIIPDFDLNYLVEIGHELSPDMSVDGLIEIVDYVLLNLVAIRWS